MFAVTALREHWDEANARVLQRKAQLDAMLGDSQRYEARRRDADAWLARMEARLANMAPPGHTADVLEMQLRDQKVYYYILTMYSIIHADTAIIKVHCTSALQVHILVPTNRNEKNHFRSLFTAR